LLLFLLPLAQLAPVPMSWWAELPGRAFYAGAMRLTGDVGEGFGWRAISLIPSTTEGAWLTLLPPLAAFLVAMRLDRERLLVLVVVFLSIAAGEALLGLIQYGQSWMSDGNALGTYRNRNHLAGLLEMALPVSLALLAATIGHGRPAHTGGRRGRSRQSVRRWVARFTVTRINQAAAFGALSLAILVGLIFTRSRTGISLAMLGVVLCTLMFSFRLGGRNAYGLIGTVTAAGIGLASLIGLLPVWSRFAFTDPFEDWRWPIFNATVQAIGEFFPLGSGAGTFLEVMRRFHPDTITGVYINRAHNDYLEWLLEFGLLAGVLVAVWLLFYLHQWGRVWTRGEWTPFRFAQGGAGIAVLLMMLHTLGDYNLRTPANAVFTAFLAGVFFHRSRHHEEHRHRHPQAAGEEARPAPSIFTIPPENQRNPFEA
ncbi:O-antigen ligase family protein, partial [uncultured Thiodictyon sp.]|uniref:O-antigen ligase family protein n=1 Tax=uncultured Thiodictyon sp. TaxID=1846217 RepID=UPI0025D1F5D3